MARGSRSAASPSITVSRVSAGALDQAARKELRAAGSSSRVASRARPGLGSSREGMGKAKEVRGALGRRSRKSSSAMERFSSGTRGSSWMSSRTETTSTGSSLRSAAATA